MCTIPSGRCIMWPEIWIAVVLRQSGVLLRLPQIWLQVHRMLYDGTPHGSERMKYRPELSVTDIEKIQQNLGMNREIDLELDWHQRFDNKILKELKIQALVDVVNHYNTTMEDDTGMQEPSGSTVYHLQTKDVDIDEEVPEDEFYMDY